MNISLFLQFTLSIFISVASSSLSAPRSATANIGSIHLPRNLSAPSPLPVYPVKCLPRPKVDTFNPSDCSYLINEVILRQPDVFQERNFHKFTYKNEHGGNVRSRWVHNSCEVILEGGVDCAFKVKVSFFNIALSANKILAECVIGFSDPIGGLSMIGYPNDRYYIILKGHLDATSTFVVSNNSDVSEKPATSVSKRRSRSQDRSENGAGLRGPGTRDPLRGTSRISNAPGRTSSNSTPTVSNHSPSSTPEYPVRCFNPLILVLPPATATDCSFIINHIILRLFNPMTAFTFGFTDEAEINLMKPWYRKWQQGRCMISVMNNDATQRDRFRMIDVARTARRVSTQCVVATERKMGGVANVGTDGRGFYVYVGGPLDSKFALKDEVLFNKSSGMTVL